MFGKWTTKLFIFRDVFVYGYMYCITSIVLLVIFALNKNELCQGLIFHCQQFNFNFHLKWQNFFLLCYLTNVSSLQINANHNKLSHDMRQCQINQMAKKNLFTWWRLILLRISFTTDPSHRMSSPYKKLRNFSLGHPLNWLLHDGKIQDKNGKWISPQFCSAYICSSLYAKTCPQNCLGL